MRISLNEIAFWASAIFCVQDIYMRHYWWAGFMFIAMIMNYFSCHPMQLPKIEDK